MLQVVMQFVSGNSGWSETHFYNSDSTQDLVNNTGGIVGPLAALQAARLGLMPYNPISPRGGTLDQLSNPRLERIRVSRINAGDFRVTRVGEPSIEQQFGTYSQTATAEPPTAVEAWTRLNCVVGLADANNQAREGRLFLGGAPESQLQPTQLYVPTVPFQNALLAYKNTLTGTARSPSLWRTRLRNTAQTPPLATPITSLVPAANGITAVLTVQPGGGFLTVGQTGQLTIRGRHPSEWNGVHRYVVTAPAPVVTLTIGPAREPLGDWGPNNGPAPNSGNAQDYSPQFGTYLYLFGDRFIHRDNGVPFGQPRGRRKKAR